MSTLEQKIRQLIENSTVMPVQEAEEESLDSKITKYELEDMVVRDADGNITNTNIIQRAIEALEMEQEGITEETDDYAGMSDSELRQAAYAAGVEDSVTLDGEGGVVNREEVIAALKGTNEAVVAEAEGDKKEEIPAEDMPPAEEVPADEELPPMDEIPGEEEAEEAEGKEEEVDTEAEGDVTVVVVSPELEPEEVEKDEKDEKDEEEEKKEEMFKVEHIDALTSDETLSEDYKAKAKTIFEAALNEQASKIEKSLKEKFDSKANSLKESYNKKVEQLEATHAEKLEEAKQVAVTEIGSIVDGYMTHAVESWVEENAVQLERNVRAELMEQFVDGLKDLFVEHYIEVPEEKFDIVKAQELQIKQLEEQAAKLTAARTKALKEATELKVGQVIAKVTNGMTDVQKARFEQLVESVEFKSIEQFEEKVGILKESYFKKSAPDNAPVKSTKKTTIVEQVVEVEPTQETPIDKYVHAISKLVR